MVKPNFSRIFLISMIVFFIASGIVGASFLLFGSFGEVQLRILLTTLTLFTFSLLGLASSRMLKFKDFRRTMGVIGLIMVSIASLLILPMIWGIISFEEIIGKIIIISSIIAVSMAHISLIIGKNKTRIINIAFHTTLILIAIVALMLIYFVITNYNVETGFWKVLGFFVILDIVGSIVTPLMRKLIK